MNLREGRPTGAASEAGRLGNIVPARLSLARRNDPVTSHLAADSLTRRTQEASALAVHKALQRGAAIDEQIAARVEARHPGKWSSQRLCTARGQLVKAGLAYDTGKLATTRRGRNAIVWALNPASEQVPLFEMGDGL